MKKLTIGIIACLLSLLLSGCNQSPKTDDATAKPNLSEANVVTPNESNSKPKLIAESQALEIAKNTASTDLESVRKLWPEAKLDTVLCDIPLIHENNTFFMYNPGYSEDMRVEAIAIGNKDDYSKMKVIYVDAFGKVIKNDYFEAKVTAKQAESIALTAAKEAKKNVSTWSNAEIKFRQTSLMLCTPNYVFPMDEPDKEIKPVETVMYEVEFMDTNPGISSLRIYVNATTGDIVGGKYTSD